MDAKNTRQTEFNGVINYSETSADRVLDKTDGFHLDTKVKEIERSLIDIYKLLPASGMSHNTIYRGYNLGDHVTESQKRAISAGTFEDLYLGDYWEISGIRYLIAGFDYWYEKSDPGIWTHHVAIVPHKAIVKGKLHETRASVAYTETDFYNGTNGNTYKATIEAAIYSAFGADYILNKKELFPTGMTDGYESGLDWIDSKIDLLNIHMVLGSNFFVPTYVNLNGDSRWPYISTIDATPLPLFTVAPTHITFYGTDGTRGVWGLRNIINQSQLFVHYSGYPGEQYVDAETNFRVVFGLIGE